MLVFVVAFLAPRPPRGKTLNEWAAQGLLLSMHHTARVAEGADLGAEGPISRGSAETALAGTVQNLIEWEVDPGYRFDVHSGKGAEFVLVALPDRPGETGDRSFAVDPEGVLRSSSGRELPGAESPEIPYFGHDVDPTFLRIPLPFKKDPLEIRYYGLLFVAAIYLGWWMLGRFVRQMGRDAEESDRMVLYIVLGLIIGARLVHLVFYHPSALLDNPLVFFAIWQGGLASHGAAIGAFVGALVFARRNRWSFLELADAAIVPIALATVFIRAGNFMNSEIVGRPADVAWATVFYRHRDAVAPWLSQAPRHPSQIYEMAMGMLVFGVLYALWRKRQSFRPGFIIMAFFVLYFSLRFTVEFFKHVDSDLLGESGFLAIGGGVEASMGQFLSLPFVAVGLPFLFRFRHPREVGGKEGEKPDRT